MRFRLLSVSLAVLVALPFAVPASAAGPGADPSSNPDISLTSSAPYAPAPETVTPADVPAADADADPTGADPADANSPSDLSDPADAVSDADAADADQVEGDLAAQPAAAPAVPTPATLGGGRPDATGRYIVMLRSGADTTAVIEKHQKRDGVKADHSFGRAVHGFSAKLDAHQKHDILADSNVLAVVPDEVIQLTAQTVPTGVSRVGGPLSDVAGIDGTDHRVDADVAIVDTGITAHPDLNVAGGYNCSTSDHSAWRDKNHHGTHVAGTVAALDNSFGVVGIAPGARVWGVKILNDDGYGLISWYVCGLDWVLAQRDPKDASKPLFEAVNMSVTKPGSDDHNCGLTNKDPLHQAICRVVAGGITVVAAAANDHHNAYLNIPAAYNEVITVSALADTDGKPGGLGGNSCYSWGGYDKDDTFADFSNYGGDVDMIAPGKCILSTIPGPGYGVLSGTSMAAPAVTGAVALYKSSRPKATPAEVREALRYLGNLNWKVSTDPDTTHEPLLDVSRIGKLGTFSLAPGVGIVPPVEGNSKVSLPVTIDRSPTFFERVTLSISSLPAGWTATLDTPSLMGWTADAARVTVAVPKNTPPGSYTIEVKGTNQGRTMTTPLTVDVFADLPTAQPPTMTLVPGIKMSTTAVGVKVAWPAATDPSSPIAGYEVQVSKEGGAWGTTVSRTAAQRDATYTLAFDTVYRFRVRAADNAGNWSPWVEAAGTSRVHPCDDRSKYVLHKGTWTKVSSSSAYKATLTGAKAAGAKIGLTFTGHSVAVLAPKSPYLGKAKVYIDGIYGGTISLKQSTSASRQLVFARDFPAGGQHVITLQVVGTGTYPLVRLDAFVISR